jgi:hypothetical protein
MFMFVDFFRHWNMSYLWLSLAALLSARCSVLLLRTIPSHLCRPHPSSLAQPWTLIRSFSIGPCGHQGHSLFTNDLINGNRGAFTVSPATTSVHPCFIIAATVLYLIEWHPHTMLMPAASLLSEVVAFAIDHLTASLRTLSRHNGTST